jgi:diguanylate cyclase (GGDEF)-like protein/PAS domain S-box-containing protein
MQMFKTNLGYGLKQWVRQERQVLMASTGITGAVILLSLIGILQASELAAFDQLFHLRLPETLDQRIVIVEINENDLLKARNWPIPDQVMAQLLQKLNSYQPRTIGLDIYRNLPVEPGQAEFVKACQTIPNLIGIEKLTDQMSIGVAPPPILSQQKQVGFNNVVIDPDGKLRRSLLYWHTDGEARQSLALKLALIYLKSEKIIPKSASSNPHDLQLAESVLSRFQANDGSYVRADSKGYQVLVNFRRPGSFRTVSMTDLLADRVNPQWIRDRVVIIGSTAPSLQDFFYNPYSNHLLGGGAMAISGVELNANFVSQILSSTLDGRPLINTLPDFLEWLWIWLWSVLGAGVVWRLRSLLQTSLGLLLISVALFVICDLAFYTGLWLPIIPPLLASFGAAAVIISYLAHLKEGLKRSKDFLQTVINTIPDPVFVKNKEHRCIILNYAYCQFVGYPLATLMEKSDYEIFPKQEADVFWAEDELVFQTGQSQENEEELTDAFGTTHLIATKKSLHKDASGNLFLVGIIRDITKHKRAEQELRQAAAELTLANIELKLSEDRLRSLAYHDTLTGLGNRKKFHEALNQALTWAQSNNQLVALMFLDLDGFKQVNDTLGHDTGDQLLRVVAQRLTNSLRNSDIVSRLGGDEFTVILPGITQADYVAKVAEKILKSLSQVFVLEGKNAFVTASIGISIYPKDGEVEDTLIKKADLAMYRAKQLGRNQHQFANFS